MFKMKQKMLLIRLQRKSDIFSIDTDRFR
jgi:hypothetical protein